MTILVGFLAALASAFVVGGAAVVHATRDGDDGNKVWMSGYDEFRLPQQLVAYRVYGGEDQRWGRRLTLHRPVTARDARSHLSLSLSPSNRARCITSVKISKGINIRIGRAGPRYGHPGGWIQIEIVDPVQRLTRAGKIHFGDGKALSKKYKYCERPRPLPRSRRETR